MSFALRPYQVKLNADIDAAFSEGARSVVAVSPTGSGKSRSAAELMKDWLRAGERTLFIAHLDTLLDDAATRIEAEGLGVGVIKAGRKADPSAPIQVGSTMTLASREECPDVDRIIVDECHHAPSASVMGILALRPKARVLGYTATPQRGDGAPMGDAFDVLVQGPSVRELTDLGHLVPAQMVVPCDEGKRGDAVAEMRRLPRGFRAIVFSESVAEGAYTAERLQVAGFRVREVYGHTPWRHRAEAFAALRSGECDVLVGVSVFVEGFDVPAVDTIVLDAAFGTLGRYLQAIGRGLRSFPGKTHCTVLDVRGAVFQHLPPDTPHEWSLTGEAVTQRLAGLAFSRCEACWAVFPRAKVCPRCGVSALVKALPMRKLQQAARMAKLEAMPPDLRRARYHAGLVHVGISRRRMSPERAKKWADEEVAKRFP